MSFVMTARRIHHAIAAFILVTLVSVGTVKAQDTAQPKVKLTTNFGEITLALFPDKAPVTVANFLAYVEKGHYDGTVFHRVIPNFMIQGGGFDTNFVERETGDPIVNESHNKLHNIRGTVAMARTSDPDSATAQFFINQRSNLRLDWAPGQPGYTVFGEVIDGMSVVDFIASGPTGRRIVNTNDGRQAPFSDVPRENVVISRMEVLAP